MEQCSPLGTRSIISIHQTEEVKHNDKLREEFLQILDLKIIRFTNDQVCNDGENTIRKLGEIIDSFSINNASL